MVAAGPLARPWRDVERLPPAVLHGNRTRHCSIESSASEVTVGLGGEGGMMLHLTPGEMAYNAVRREGQEAVAKLPLSRLLGAKVCTEACKAHLFSVCERHACRKYTCGIVQLHAQA